MKFRKDTIIGDIITELDKNGYKMFYKEFTQEVTSPNFINNVAMLIFKIKDNFKSSEIESEDWNFYQFPWFSASLPKQNWNAVDVVNAEKDFLRQIIKWFIRAQALAIYEDDIEEFYISIFCNDAHWTD